MTPKKYQEMIDAGGGYTKAPRSGDRPQPLTEKDEAALDKAWSKTAGQVAVKSRKRRAKAIV